MAMFFASQLVAFPSFWENFKFQSMGFVIVMCALAALWFVVSGLGLVCRRTNTKEEKCLCSTDQLSAAPAAAIAAGGLDAEIAAVIAAAVAMTVGKPHRISSIIQFSPDAVRLQAWSMEGRRQIHVTRRAR
ncbi:MAG: OadG family transporter subunit [bacterium]